MGATDDVKKIYGDRDLTQAATIKKFFIVQTEGFMSDYDRFLLKMEEQAKE